MANPFLGLGFNSWTQKFGRSAASALKLVVGAFFQDSYKGAVFIFDVNDLTTSTKVNCEADTSTFDSFGISVAIGNSKIAAGMRGADDAGSGSGSAFVYDLDGTNEVKLTASDAAAGDNFGSAVAIGNSKVAVGAKNENAGGTAAGAAYVYNLDGSGEVKITASDAAANDEFGFAVAIANNKLYVGAPGDDDDASSSGSVYIYNLDGSGESKITASDGAASAKFGSSLAIGHDKLVVGAEGEVGAVYVYDLDGSNEVKITASDGAMSDKFGISVAIGSNKIVVGATKDDDDGSASGAAYVYNLDGSGEVKITASDAAANDNFGSAVAVGGNKIYVGASNEDTGGSDTGSIYIYNLDGSGESKIPNPEGDGNARFGASMALGS